MKLNSIQTRIIVVISAILIAVVAAFMFTSTVKTNAILDNDSDSILLSAADYYADIIDDNFRSTEQSVGTIYNYAIKRAETHKRFLEDEADRDLYTNDISELGKSIAENTRGAMAVYLRYNPDDYGPSDGFWYTINLSDRTWQSSVPTDMSLYDRDDLEHVGWYYIPVEAGVPMWMDPYYNANLGVDMISYIIPYFYGDYTVGIIGMDISMDLLKESVAQVSVYKSGQAFLMDRNGNLIYHRNYPDGMYYDSLSETDRAFFGNLLEMDLNAVKTIPGRDGTQLKLVLKGLKNGMILGVYAPLTEIREPQKSLMGQLIVISAAILFLAIIVGLLLVRSITGPLKKMTEVAQNYANGDFKEEISVHGADEVGILSRSLQSMSASLKEQIELADSANKAKSEFLANMSHEIRTPINAVLGMNEMILRETTDEPIREYSANIQTAGRTLLSLINSILDFSKIEDGKMEIIPVSYDTVSLINNLSNSISERAREKNLAFELDIDESLPFVMRGDDVRVSQVIMNLLTNAVKYTETGKITLSIRVAGRLNEFIDLLIKVQDTGIGIREEDMSKLYESFTRIDEKKNRNIEGTGLGMAIVTRLLGMMNSELHVESVYGKGSTFSFTLRQQIVDGQPIGDYEKRLRASYQAEAAGEYPTMRGAKILVVDDYEMNLKVVKNLLKIYGISPDLVSSGREAIKAMRNKQYHIVFLDHMMPQMDGIETLKKLREENLVPDSTAVIALTANAVVGAKETYLSAGFDDYLTKPIGVEMLGEMLFRHLPDSLISYAETAADRGDVAEDSCVQTEDGLVILEFAPKEGVISEVEEQEMNRKEMLEQAGISTQDGLKYCADDESFYEELLSDYVSAYDEKSEQLKAYYSDKDWAAYRILIHAIKSTSRMIGAEEIAVKAKELEDASAASDEAAVTERHETFLGSFREIRDKIAKALAL